MSEEQDPRPATPDPAPDAPARTSWVNRGFWLGGSLGCLVPIVLIVAAGLWVVHLAREELGGKLDTPSIPGETTLSLDWDFEPVSDVAPAFADVRGKVVFLNVWATWCNPCVMEMPSIQGLYQKVSDNPKIAVVCVSNETRAKIRGFLAEKELTLPVYRAPDDIPKALHTDGIPATFILDPTGKIMFQHVGAARWDDDMVVSFLDSLAAGES